MDIKIKITITLPTTEKTNNTRNQNITANKNKPVLTIKNQTTNQNTNQTDHHHHTKDNNHVHHIDQIPTAAKHTAAIAATNKTITNLRTKDIIQSHQTDHHTINHTTNHRHITHLDHKVETNHLAHNKNNFQAFCQESIAQQTIYHGYQKIAKNAAHTPTIMNAIVHNTTDSIKQNAPPVEQVTICRQNVNHTEANHRLDPKITFLILIDTNCQAPVQSNHSKTHAKQPKNY